jgi:hypothetical protein
VESGNKIIIDDMAVHALHLEREQLTSSPFRLRSQKCPFPTFDVGEMKLSCRVALRHSAYFGESSLFLDGSIRLKPACLGQIAGRDANLFLYIAD